eukprot:125606_1
MAAQLTHTGSTSGEHSQNSIDDVEINEWLTQNRLTKLKQYFEENEVIMSDLLHYEEEDMNVVLKDVHITAGAYVKRFKDAVRQLQFKYNNTNSQQNKWHMHRVYRTRVVTSAKEDKCITLLENKLIEIDLALQNNLSITSRSLENTKHVEKDIIMAMNSYKNKLMERQKVLIAKLNQTANEKLNELQNQKHNLEKYKISIQTAQKEQNGLVLDPKMDRTKREIKIDQITNDVINGMNHNDMKPSIIPLVFDVDDSVSQYISSIGVIASHYDAPTLSITDITVQSAKIEIVCKVDDEINGYKIKCKQSDDEKKMNWKDIASDKNEYTFMNLEPNTKYVVCGKYKMSKDNTWSRLSETKTFQTLIRQGKWDTNNLGTGVVIDGNVATWTNKKWEWNAAVGTVAVNKGKHEWKLRIDTKPNSGCITLGVVTTNNEERRWPFVWTDDNNCGYAFGTGDGRLKDVWKGFKWKSGDDIVMVFDVSNCSMKYTINGQSATIQNPVPKVPVDTYKIVVCNIGVGAKVRLVSYRAL